MTHILALLENFAFCQRLWKYNFTLISCCFLLDNKGKLFKISLLQYQVIRWRWYSRITMPSNVWNAHKQNRFQVYSSVLNKHPLSLLLSIFFLSFHIIDGNKPVLLHNCSVLLIVRDDVKIYFELFLKVIQNFSKLSSRNYFSSIKYPCTMRNM